MIDIDNRFLDRFWKKVDKKDDGECWNWLASKDKDGYGYFWIKEHGECRKAHRVSWLIHTGEWPNGLMCHHCDNPSCVNPKHLFDGSPRDNTQDMIDKNRKVLSLGERHGNSKLTKSQVLLCRNLWDSGKVKQKDLAKQYDVSTATISLIVRRKLWSWL